MATHSNILACNASAIQSTVVKLDSKGNITAVAIGQAIITLQWSSLGYNDCAEINVTVAPNLVMELDKYEVEIVAEKLTSTSENSTTDTVSVIGVYVENNKVDNPAIIWTSEDDSIATVVNGIISAVSKGQTTICASYNANDIVSVTSNLTFTANWTPINYTITYNLAGGSVSAAVDSAAVSAFSADTEVSADLPASSEQEAITETSISDARTEAIIRFTYMT